MFDEAGTHSAELPEGSIENSSAQDLAIHVWLSISVGEDTVGTDRTLVLASGEPLPLIRLTDPENPHRLLAVRRGITSCQLTVLAVPEPVVLRRLLPSLAGPA